VAILETLLGFSGQLTIGDLTCDASVSEVHNTEADVTEHPVETGSDISEHYRKRPRMVSIDGIVTATPLETSFPGATAVSAVKSAISGDDPVASARDLLNSYFDDAKLITIATSFNTYDNVALLSLKVTRGSRTGQAMHFSCTAKQLRIVDTRNASALAIPGTAGEAATTTAAKGQGAANAGKKGTKTASGAQSKSALAKIVDGGKSLFGV